MNGENVMWDVPVSEVSVEISFLGNRKSSYKRFKTKHKAKYFNVQLQDTFLLILSPTLMDSAVT